MSEGVSEILRSNKPSSLKRRRAEDLESGGSTGQSGCLYKGCRKSRNQKNGTWGTHRPFCSKTHRDFFMAELFDVIRNGGARVTEEPSGICKLPGCNSELRVCEPYDFCSYDHVIKYRGNTIVQWKLDGRLCNYEPCFHHVHIEETSKIISKYCRHKHRFAAVAAETKQGTDARTEGGKDPVNSDENRQISISQEVPQQLFQAKLEKKRGYHQKVSREAIVCCLEHLLIHAEDFRNADPSGLFCRVETILDFHPFHEVTESRKFKPRWYLHFHDSNSIVPRTTKEGFGWKQTSGGHETSVGHEDQQMITTYFSYEFNVNGYSKDDPCDGHVLAYFKYEEDKKAGRVESGSRKRWKMHEFSLSDDRVKAITGGMIPRKIPVISNFFQDKRGLPVWPLPKEKETRTRKAKSNENNASVTVGSIPEVQSDVGELEITGHVSLNASPPGDGLPSGGGILQGGNLHSFQESDDFPPLQDMVVEVFGNESNSLVPVEPFQEAAVHVEEREMISIFFNPSPPDEDLSLGTEIPEMACFNELDESNGSVFLQDYMVIPTSFDYSS